MTQKVEELAKKAHLSKVPELCVSKTERLAHVNVFQWRISVGEYLLSQWAQGNFDEADVEATLAHEIGHLMDFNRNSKSSSFRNLLLESVWLAFGVVPLAVYLLLPSLASMVFCLVLAAGWGFSLPWIVRYIEVHVELEADRKAALFLVKPQQLADALLKISSFGVPVSKFGLAGRLSFLAGTLTHPTFRDRVRHLQAL